MNETVETCIRNMNELQRRAVARRLDKAEKACWKTLCRTVRQNGYTLRHRSVRDAFGNVTGCVWSAVKGNDPTDRNGECPFVYTDNRPKDRRTLKGDCTTRCMTYALNGTMTYDEIERRQYELAEERGTRRNTRGTWDAILTEHGFVTITLSRKVKRSVLASILSGLLTKPVASRSSKHVAAIDNDGVHDTWDSRGGMVYEIFVAAEDVDGVKRVLVEHGISIRISTVLCVK